MKKSFDIIVVGGGSAGMMAAGRAGELGARALLVEKNDRLGKKLSMTGGRRCNITNAETDNRVFLENFPESKQFLFSPFSQFNVKDTFEFFEKLGLPLVIEDRKRAFPKSQSAQDVCNALINYINQSKNVDVQLNTAFKSFKIKAGKIIGINTSAGTFFADKVIIATGGLAAPETGSTGEGLNALNEIGHKIKEPDANLAPLRTKSKWVHKLSGTSLDDIGLRFIQKNKKLKSLLNTLLQKSLVEAMLNMLESDMIDLQVHSITKQQRKSLVQIMNDLRFPIQGTMGLEWSIVADGGVDPKEINFKTMASRLYPNLYLIGDTIDINRPSGGFSLQLCWTTGFVAGTHSTKGF